MQAAYAARTGGDDPLANLEVGDREVPALRPGWALVRVEAAALNQHDLWTLRGVSSHPIVLPQILGTDAAGTVVELGPDCPPGTPPPGTRVVLHAVLDCGRCWACREGDELACEDLTLLSEAGHPGTLAEFVAVPADNLLPLPEGVDPVAAACLPTAYLTAYRMIVTRARLTPGDTLLVQGAGGGVASAAILLARAAGIRAIATARDPSKREAARQLGAIAALEPVRESLAEIRALTGGRGVDAVVETVGAATWDLSLRACRPGGVIVVAGATTGADPPAQLRRVFWRQLTIAGSTMGTRAELRRLVDLVASGTVTPLVDSVFSLQDARAALARLAAGTQVGKIVVRPG